MSNLIKTPEYYQALEANRSPDAVALETVRHYITLFFMSHPGLNDEIDQFNASQDAMRTLAAGDEATETYLLLTDAKQWYASLYAHNWKERR